jgi:hypothetical protein
MAHSTKAFTRGSIVIGLLALPLLSLFGWNAPPTSADSESTSYLPLIVYHSAHLTETPTAETTATATQSSPTTAPATPTATATSTPAATTTATGTPVANCSRIYPITLASSLLDNDNFRPPSDPQDAPYFGVYNSPTYGSKTWRRIYLTDLGFRFVRWRADTPDSVQALVASLSGTGNIAQGFQEAPWPSGTAFGTQPASYPAHPGQLNASDGDWIYGSNASISSDVLAALQYHIDNTTLMALPISDGIVGSGANVTDHVERLGDFLLFGYGNQGGEWYLDLVSIGNSTAPQCG